MLNRPIPKTAKLGILGLIAVIITGAVLLPTAKAKDSVQRIANSEQGATEKSEFKATLSNGVTIELVGLAYVPVKDQPWWKCDGSLLERSLFDRVDCDPSENPYRDRLTFYAVAYRLNGGSGDDIHIKWRLGKIRYATEAEDWPKMMTPFITNTNAYVGDTYAHDISAASVRLPKSAETATLRLGVASGEWETLFTGRHFGFYEKGEDTARVSTPERAGGPGRVRLGEKGLHIDVTYNITDRDFRVVAVDKEGKIHLSSRIGSGGTKNLRRTTASFPDLTRRQLQEYCFQTRLYEWVEFKNVSLRPGQKTDVEVEREGVRVYKVNRSVADFIGTDLPASVETVKFFSADAFGEAHFLIRFDVPLPDLKTLLEKSDRLPDFEGFKEDPGLQKGMKIYADWVGWWKPDELESPVCARWTRGQQAVNAPDVCVYDVLSICCSQITDSLMRVYVDFFTDSDPFSSIPQAFFRGRGQLQLDKEIPIKLECGTTQKTALVKCDWIRFEKSEDKVKAVLHLRLCSWPKAKWEIRVRLLDAKDTQLSDATAILESSGIIAGVPNWSEEDLRFSLGKQGDVSEAVKFEVRIRQLLDAADVEVEVGVAPLKKPRAPKAAPTSERKPARRARRADVKTNREVIVAKLVNLENHRLSVQRDLDSANKGLDEVRARFGFTDLEERSYPHPITERLMRLEQERDNCVLEIAQLKANIANLLKQPASPEGKEKLKKVKDNLTVLEGKLEALNQMVEEAKAQEGDLDRARIEYKKRIAIRDERRQRLNELKSQIDKLQIMHDEAEARRVK